MPRVPTPTRRGLLIGGLSTLTLTAGGSAWALDRYVIDHVEVADATAYEASQGSVGAELDTTDAVLNDRRFRADGTTVTVREVKIGSGAATVTYFVADIVLSDATVLRSAFADDAFGRSIIDETSDIAAQNGAVFAVNGDYYGFRDTGMVIRNGVVYRDSGAREGLAFYRDGRVELYDETATTAQALVDDGVWNTLSFGPALVANGQVLEGIDDIEIDTNFGNRSIQGDHPRTAIGVIEDNHLLVVVVDGRETGYSVGVTMTELATLMTDLGAVTAYNIDGGGSSTFFFNGKLRNRPSNGGERGTSDILYIRG